MTPLVDVMLVLVVIFILTAPLLSSTIRLNLPQAEGAQPDAAVAPVSLVVDASGQIFLDDRPITPEALRPLLQAAAAHDVQTEVQIRADTAVPYGRVLNVMGWARAAGLNRIGFVTEPGQTASDKP